MDRTVAQEATGLWGKEVCAWVAAEAEDLIQAGEESLAVERGKVIRVDREVREHHYKVRE